MNNRERGTKTKINKIKNLKKKERKTEGDRKIKEGKSQIMNQVSSFKTESGIKTGFLVQH